MLLNIFRTNKVYNFILVPVTGILLMLNSLINPGVFPSDESMSYSPLFVILRNSGVSFFGAVLVNFAATMVISFQLLSIYSRFDFVRERTFLPVYLFLFITLALPDMHVIQPVTFSAIFVLQAIWRLFEAYDARKVHSHAFDAGFLLGVAGLFYIPVTCFIFLIPLSLNTIKGKWNWREIVNPFVGLFLPWIFALSYFFIFKKTEHFFELINLATQKREITILQKWQVLVYFIYLVVITLVSSFFILKHYDSKKISTRRYFKILFFFFVSSLLLLIFPAVSYEILIVLSLPLAFLITNYLTFMRRRLWAEIFFAVLILISIVLQFFIQ